jgi:hypothetical protein
MPQQRTDHIARLPLFNLPRTWNRLYTELSDTQVKHIFFKSSSPTTFWKNLLMCQPAIDLSAPPVLTII